MEAIGLLGMLGITTYEDIHRKEVHSIILLAFAILGMAFHLIFHKLGIYDILGGFAIGGLMMILCLLSKERIGMGDAILLMVTGIYLGFLKNLFLLWASLSFMGIFCLFGYLMKKIRKEDRIPFYPFVLCAFLVILLISGGDLYA